MGARTGEEFLDGLRKTSREIWVDGERIDDVTSHPKLAGGAATLASIFDRQHTFADECLYTHPDTGEATNVSHMIPRSHDDLWKRHAGLTRISEGSMGIMGRTPDYMNMKYSGFASAPEVWAGPDGRNAKGAENLLAFQRYLGQADISLTHTIINPTVDKRTDGTLVGNNVPVHKVGETSEGIIVRGAKVLATLAPYADEQTVYPALPIPPEASAYALAFAVPLDTPGLKFLCRDSAAAPGANLFDRPHLGPLRRAGRLLHLRRRAHPLGPGVHRRRRRDLQQHPGHRVHRPHDRPVHHPGPHQAGVRLRPGHPDGRDDRRLHPLHAGDAGRAGLLRADDPQRGGAVG